MHRNETRKNRAEVLIAIVNLVKLTSRNTVASVNRSRGDTRTVHGKTVHGAICSNLVAGIAAKMIAMALKVPP